MLVPHLGLKKALLYVTPDAHTRPRTPARIVSHPAYSAEGHLEVV